VQHSSRDAVPPFVADRASRENPVRAPGGHPAARPAPRRRRRRLALAVWLARALCVVFALVGAVPFAAGLLLRTRWAQAWAAREASAALRNELGLEAAFEATIRPWPLSISATELRVESSDGSGAALRARRVVLRPKFFALLQGRLDAGEIEIDRPHARVVVRDGKLANVALKQLPERTGPRPTRAPFASIAVNDATVELDLDGTLVQASGIDLDVAADDGPAFDVSLRAVSLQTRRTHAIRYTGIEAPPPVVAVAEDTVCKLDARGRIEPSGVLVRRLRVEGRADLDPAAGTPAGCAGAHEDLAAVRLEMLNVHAALGDDGVPSSLAGHVSARGPLGVVNRFVPFMVLEGWAGVDLDAAWRRGQPLPEVRGTVRGHGVSMGIYSLAHELDATVRVEADAVRAPWARVGFADGTVDIQDLEVRPLAPGVPVRAASLTLDRLQLPGLVRDLGVTNRAHVRMLFKDGVFSDVQGTIDPLRIDSDLVTHLSDFEVFDRPHQDPARRHLLGVAQGTVRARFAVRPKAVEFQNAQIDFGRSHLGVFASLGFSNEFRLAVSKGSHVELGDVTPLVDIPWSGGADLTTDITGLFHDPTITSELSIARFDFAGFPFGDVLGAKLRFRPYAIDLSEVRGRKGSSVYRIPTMRIDFPARGGVVVDAGLESADFDLRDLLAVLRFETDPRFTEVKGGAKVGATMRYEMGGGRDACGGGWMSVRAKASLSRLELFEERYDGGEVDLDYTAFDRSAQELGIEVDVRSLLLRKGAGSIVGSGTVRAGGVVRGHVAASGVPLAKLQALGDLGKLLDATVSASAEIGGTIDRLEAKVDATMSPLRLGTAVLPASRASVHLVPVDRPLRIVGRSRCGLPIGAPFDRAEFDRDAPVGLFDVAGQLFGGQVLLRDLQVTRQRHKQVRGELVASGLDLGALAQARPGLGGSASRPTGTLSGTLAVRHVELDAPSRADVELVLSKLAVQSGQGTVKLREGTPPITLRRDELDVPRVLLDFSTPRGIGGTFAASGKVHAVATSPEMDLTASLLPADLSSLAGAFPRIERARGVVQAKVAVTGSPLAPTYRGEATLRGGALRLRGLALPIDEANVDVRIGEREITLARASAKIGGGQVTVVGSLPVKGFDLGQASVFLSARGVSLPLVEGVAATIDADLGATWSGRLAEAERSLPRVVGDVTLVSFDYTRPIAISADIGALTQRVKRTKVEAYDPNDDYVSFEVRLRAARPLRFHNNLVDMQLVMDPSPLTLSGTNQRIGLRGELRVKPGGRMRLRANEFELRQGIVRFDDPTRVAPIVDVTAVTEYRRYSQVQAAPGASGAASAGAASGKGPEGVGKTGGQWRIQLHAHGDAENLRLDLSSEPALSQEDIVLLLTLGVTRAELDQMQASNLGETAALEALSTLTGADSAVRDAIPVIDDFRLGSTYSARTGRTEPTVTVGKRVTERVRANVTSGLSDNREIRSNLEWQLTQRTSVLGSYDNVNNVSSSTLGNLGADLRFRIEFQ
jgi:translocation and assembly module TamB